MKINLYEVVKTDTLRHRDTAQKIIKIINETPREEETVIDFNRIVFASRSFCHELIKGLQNQKTTFINMSKEVNEMMQISKLKLKIDPRDTFTHKKLEKVTR